MAIRIDAHAHLWRLGRGDYAWLDGGDERLAPLRRDFELADLPDAAPGAATVLVQAAPTVAETKHLLDQARAGGRAVAGVVGWVDLSDPAAADELARLAADPAFKGVRPMLQDLAEPDWITARADPACLDALARAGLRLDALVTPRELPHLRRFVEGRPDLPMMVDHAAKPPLAAPPADGRWAVWRSAMRALAAAPNTCCKLSGLLTEMRPGDRATPDTAAAALRPILGDLLDWFGPARLAWGSDWPVVTLAASARFWRDTTEQLLVGLAGPDRDAVLGDTAARFYGLGIGEAPCCPS